MGTYTLPAAPDLRQLPATSESTTETHYRDGAPCNGCEHLIDVAGSDYVHLGDPLPAHHSFGAGFTHPES